MIIGLIEVDIRMGMDVDRLFRLLLIWIGMGIRVDTLLLLLLGIGLIGEQGILGIVDS